MGMTNLFAGLLGRLRPRAGGEVRVQNWILLVASDKYASMVCLLIASLLVRGDLRRVKGVVVGDIGLSEESRARIRRLYPETVFLAAETPIANVERHQDAAWVDAVSRKTLMVRQALEAGYVPLVLLDADQFICRDFLDDLDEDMLISVACRDGAERRPVHRIEGARNRYIASFVRFATREATGFLDEWIAEMQRRIRASEGPPFETPALNEVFYRDPAKWAAEEVPVVAYTCPPQKYKRNVTRIVHYKGPKTIEDEETFRAWVAKLPGMGRDILRKYDSV